MRLWIPDGWAMWWATRVACLLGDVIEVASLGTVHTDLPLKAEGAYLDYIARRNEPAHGHE